LYGLFVGCVVGLFSVKWLWFRLGWVVVYVYDTPTLFITTSLYS
jgi:hypothetical protein